MTDDNKTLVYMHAYTLAKTYTRGFFAGVPTNGKFMAPDMYDAIQAAIFNTFVDGYHQGARDMETAKVKNEEK